MYKKYKLLICFGVLAWMSFLCSSCGEDDLDQNLFAGLWIQEQITEDGNLMALSDKEKTLRLFIEANGAYRSFASDGTTPDEHYGTWIVTDDKWIDFTVDTWHIRAKPDPEKPAENGEWGKNHLLTRFSILSITDDKMEIRIKTYLGEKKYGALFTEHGHPDLTLDNVEEIENEFKVYRTYVFTFRKAK